MLKFMKVALLTVSLAWLVPGDSEAACRRCRVLSPAEVAAEKQRIQEQNRTVFVGITGVLMLMIGGVGVQWLREMQRVAATKDRVRQPWEESTEHFQL